jgi:hypothetical protein
LSIFTVVGCSEHVQVPLPKIALVVELTGHDDVGATFFVDRRDAPQPDTVGLEALLCPAIGRA